MTLLTLSVLLVAGAALGLARLLSPLRQYVGRHRARRQLRRWREMYR